MKQIKILLWFDVEDYVTPESDDAFLKLLQMLDGLGVRATIKFCTKKAERLGSVAERRGHHRTDKTAVLDAETGDRIIENANEKRASLRGSLLFPGFSIPLPNRPCILLRHFHETEMVL